MSRTRTSCIAYPHLVAAKDALGLTDEELALQVGMKKSKWRRIIQGVGWPTRNQLVALCRVLRLSPEQIPHKHIPSPSKGETR